MVMKKFNLIARALILNSQQVLLAHQKGANNTFLPGGHIQIGESAATALKREINEELGLSSELEGFLGYVENVWKDGEIENFEINLIFNASISNLDFNSPLISYEEHLEFFWSSVGDLKRNNLLPFPLQKLIKNYLSGNKSIWWASTLS